MRAQPWQNFFVCCTVTEATGDSSFTSFDTKIIMLHKISLCLALSVTVSLTLVKGQAEDGDSLLNDDCEWYDEPFKCQTGNQVRGF